MEIVFILAIIFGGSILAIAAIGGTVLLAIKIIKGGASRSGQKAESEEARMVQEIYEGLSRMEERVEALETLLIERKGKEREL